MWKVSNNSIAMTEGDYGVALPVTISGVEIAVGDSVKFTVKKGNDTVLEKEFSSIQHNTVNLELTEQESESLTVGVYVYTLDWYQDGNFMCNIFNGELFKVVDKA